MSEMTCYACDPTKGEPGVFCQRHGLALQKTARQIGGLEPKAPPDRDQEEVQRAYAQLKIEEDEDLE